MSILEPLCGSGRFLVPFLKKGFRIKGVDNSSEMLGKLLAKAPEADVTQCDIEKYETLEQFDYIFITSGSVCLFTDMQACKRILSKMKTLLKNDGKFVFAVDTIADRTADSTEYKAGVTVNTKENDRIVLKSKSYFDESTHTQFGPSIYELYHGDALIQQEKMDFQIHLYELGEMETILRDIGFGRVQVYASFKKDPAKTNDAEMFLYECSL